MKIRFRESAEEDARSAKSWYADQRGGLELEFGRDLDRILGLVGEYPRLFPVVYRDLRRANLDKFPYSVFYLIEDDTAWVLAIVHHARDPAVWQDRR